MRKFYLLFLSSFLFACIQSFSQISLSGPAYTQDFNTLAISGTSSTLPSGWLMSESAANANALYTAGTGSSNSGDTYSFGASANTERAFGGLQSGSLIPTIGASFTNNTGSTLTSLTLSFTGEQWRIGTLSRADRLDFQYSVNATSLTTGTWTDENNLDFTAPNITGPVGALDGNLAANRTVISFNVTGLSISNGSTFFIRWTDFNATGADDGLAIDDFTVAATGGSGPLTITTSSPLPNGTVGVAYNQTISASGGTAPYSFIVSAGALPAGTTLAASGAITGTPTASGTFNFTVDATDAAPATVSKAFAITIINAPCSPSTHTIAEIQGAGNLSPLVGNVETTSGIVTGIRSNGFFMQTPDASADADPNTSEGIFVFTSSAPPPAVVIGNNVCVTGTIAEFVPSTDPNSPAQTEIVSPSVTVLSTGNPLPAAIVLTTANTNPASGLYQLERFEGMRVQVNSMTVVAPTQGNKTESAATSVSNGFFYGVITGVARPFREAGVAQPDPLPPGAPVTVTRWDANPELIGVGSNSIGGVAIDVATGAILTNVVGPLDYRSRAYTIDIDPAIPPVVSNNGLTFTAVPVQTADELTVASFNVERFYDDINDPVVSDVALTTLAYNNRLNKVSLAIRNVLRTPDILCMVEVEKLAVLQAIATKVNADAVAAGDPNPNYVAYLVEGNDVGGIDVGFLVKSARVTVTSVTQYGLADTYINPTTGLPELLNDRPPLVLNGTFTKPGCTTSDAITVIVNHLRSLNGIDDVGSNGIRVRAKRQAQAEFLANLIQGFQTTDPTANIISVGDYNAFEFSDGYVDMIGTIKGTPTPASDVVVASPDLVNPDLTDLADAQPAAQRYSYSFSGSAQVLDHILVNSNLASKISRFNVARVDADFPEVYRTDANRPERISDHDAPVAYILFTDNIAPTITCPANITTVNTTGQCGAIVNFPAPTTTDNCSSVTVTSVPASGSLFPIGTTTVTSTATDAGGNTATCTFTITVTDTEAPVFTCPVNITRSNDPGQCSAVVNYTIPAATDNCPGSVTVTRTVGPASGSVFPLGTSTITHTATDASGNTATCTFTVTVNDVQPPVITCPANIVVSNTLNQCGAIVNFTPVAADNCPIGTTTPVTINQSSSATVTAGSVSCNAGGLHTDNSYWRAYDLAPLALAGPYTINTVRFGIETATASGPTQPVNVRIYTQTTGTFPGGTRTLVRNQTFNIPNQTATIFSANLTTPVTVPANSVVILELNTPDGQTAGNSFFIGSNAAAETGPSYISAADCGITTPTLLSAVGFPNMHILLSAVGTVPVPGSGTVSVPASGSFFPVGTTTVTSTATDGAGNTATCSFTVRVNDTQAPAITCPANITVTTATGSCVAPVTYAVTATDNCPGVTTALTAGLASGASFPIGVTTVTHRATDAAGNITSCSFTVTVLDGQLPVISAQPVNRTVCTGTSAVFSVTSSNAVSYQWQQYIAGVWTNIAGQTGSTLTLNAVNVGMNDNSYRVNVIGLCTTVSSGFASLYVNPLPSVSLTASNPPVLLPTQSTSIVANVNPTGGTFAWFKNGAALSPAVTIGTLANLTVESAGTYRTIYTDLNGCVNTSGDLVISAEPSDRLYIAPNPNFGQFWVRYYNQVNEQLTLTVFNSNGARVYQKAVTTTLAYSRIDVDLGIEAPGVYVVELRNSTGKLLGSKKMIVSHR